MQIESAKVKMLQEAAIATRIEMAEEVEIEEFYDLSGETSMGVQVNEAAVSAGVGATGKKVVKRVIRFKGFNSSVILDSEEN